MTCPWCGRRPAAEFLYGREADRSQPLDSGLLSEAGWADYLFGADNPKGPARELWLHEHGCRRWFVATRDTRTNGVLDSRP